MSAPLKIVRPFTLDGGRALVQIVTLGPGLCGGDACTIDVTVEPGARAVVMMQTASRILGMSARGASATQTVNLIVAPGGQLEYYPGLTIPFADSDLKQRVTVSAHRESRVGILESWSMGRATRAANTCASVVSRAGRASRSTGDRSLQMHSRLNQTALTRL